jgi:hypothetical protein
LVPDGADEGIVKSSEALDVLGESSESIACFGLEELGV